MGRTLALLAVALAAVAPGCNGTPRVSTSSLFGRPAERSRAATADSNPFQRTRTGSTAARANDERDGVKSVAAARPSAVGESGKTPATSRVVPHDPETRRLIAEEVRNAPIDERADLERELDGLHPEMVRAVLRVRRLERQMRQGNSDQFADVGREPGILPTSGTEANPVQLTAGEAAYNPDRRDAGIGTIDPWEQPDRAPAASGRPLVGGHSFDPSVTGFDPARGARIEPADLQQGAQGTGVAANAGSSRPRGHSIPLPPLPGQPAGAGRAVLNPPVPPAEALEVGASGVGLAPPPVPGVETPAVIMPGPRPLQTAANVPNAPLLPNPGLFPPSGDVPPPVAVPPAAGDWGQQLQTLIGLAEADAAGRTLGERPSDEEQRAYVERHVYLRMLYLMAGQQERALAAIPGIDAADQEFWQQTFWAVANYFDTQAMPDRGDRAAQTIAQLRKAIQRLQEAAHLELRNVTFCHKITSFGSYERFERDEFSPGQPVLVYSEVGNFASEPTVDGQFRTILKSTVEIYKAGRSGDLVERMEFPATEDLCRNYRRDYFHSYEFTMPQKLSLGPHVLKLTVEDQLSRKVATYTLNFTVK